MSTFASAGRVVVGIDGSVSAGTAAEWAARRAEALGVGLTMVAVLPPLRVPRSLSEMMRQKADDYAIRVVEASREKLEADAAELRAAHPRLDVETALVENSEPAVELVRATQDALVVVAGARGIGSAKPMALGSVSRHLVTHAQGLVAVIPDTGLAIEPSFAGTVVVGVQEAGSSPALLVAAEEARRLGGRLVVSHSWEYSPVGIDGLPTMDVALFEQTSQELTARVAEEVRARVGDDIPFEVRVDIGHAGETLLELSHEAELVVVGSRGRSGLSGMLLGSTAIHVLRQSISPVLLVPIKD